MLGYTTIEQETEVLTNYIVSIDTRTGEVVDTWQPVDVWGVAAVAIHHNTSRLYVADFYGHKLAAYTLEDVRLAAGGDNLSSLRQQTKMVRVE